MRQYAMHVHPGRSEPREVTEELEAVDVVSEEMWDRPDAMGEDVEDPGGRISRLMRHRTSHAAIRLPTTSTRFRVEAVTVAATGR